MFDSNTTNGASGAAGDNRNTARIAREEAYHQRVRSLHSETTRHILRMARSQADAQKRATVEMTRALEKLVVRTTEMVGFMIGNMLAGGDIAGKNMFANFLDMLGQFSVMLGTMAVAASKVLESLFSGNPAALFVSGLAMIAIGGLIKAFASQLKSQGASLGSGAGMPGAVPLGGGAGTGSSSLTPLGQGDGEQQGQTVYYYHFEGGLYDERGLARYAAKALNRHAGRSAPFLSRSAVEGLT